MALQKTRVIEPDYHLKSQGKWRKTDRKIQDFVNHVIYENKALDFASNTNDRAKWSSITSYVYQD